MNTIAHTLDAPPPTSARHDVAIIALVGLAHASSHFAHLLLATFFPIFHQEFGLSFSDLGLLATAFFVVSGVGQTLSGFVVDRVGPRPVLFASLICFVLACLAAASAQGWWGLLLAALLAGLGNAPFHPVDFSILNLRLSPQRLGYGFSVHGIMGNLGWAAAPVFLVTCMKLWDWRSAYLAAAALYGVVLLVLLLGRQYVHAQVQPHAPDATARSDMAFLKLPVVWWCFSFFLFSTMTLAVVQNFASPLMQALHGVRLEAATAMLTAYMLCGAAGMVVGGVVAARLPLASDRVVASSMSAAVVLMLITASGWLGATGSMAALAVTGFAIGIGGPSRDMLIKRATPKGATGRVYGTVYAGLDTGFAIAPIAYGWLMDAGHYRSTLLLAAVYLAFSVIAALGVGRRVLAPGAKST